MMKICFRNIWVPGMCFFLIFGVPFHTRSQSPISPKDSVSVETYLIEGKKQSLLGNAGKAGEAYENALEIDPGNATAQYELARNLLKKNQLEDALDHAKAAVRYEPSNPWYLRLLAEVSRQSSDFTALAKAYDGLAKISKSPAVYLRYEANALAMAGASKKALALLKKSIKKHPEHEVDFLLTQANIYHDIGQHKKEFKTLQKILKYKPDNLSYLSKLASALLRDNKKEEAAQVFQHIYRLDPTDTRAAEEMARPYLVAADFSSFFRTLDPVLRDPYVSAKEKVRLLMPAIEILSRDTLSAPKETLRNIVYTLEKMHPKQAVVFALGGDIGQILGDDEGALKSYRKALALERNVLSVWEQTLSLLLNKPDWKALLETTEEAQSLFPAVASFSYYKAIALFHLGKLDKAGKVARKSYVMSGRNNQQKTLSLSLMGLIRSAGGDHRGALSAMKKALKLSSAKTLQILNDFIVAHDPSELESAFRHFKTTPGFMHCCQPESAYVSAFLDLKSGRYEMASKALEALIDKPEPIAFPRWQLYQWLEEAHEKMGQMQKAEDFRALRERIVNSRKS